MFETSTNMFLMEGEEGCFDSPILTGVTASPASGIAIAR